MGTVIRFPLERRFASDAGRLRHDGEPATVIVLPVIRMGYGRRQPPPQPSAEAQPS